MTKEKEIKKPKRLGEIEDRKIEILMEIANINNNYSKKVSQLSSEYEELHREYFELQVEYILKKQKA
jgi:hypothetical protein